MIRVTSRQHNHAAAGRTWPAQTCCLDDADLTPAELAELQADPLLIVEAIPDPAPQPASKKTKTAEPAVDQSQPEAV